MRKLRAGEERLPFARVELERLEISAFFSAFCAGATLPRAENLAGAGQRPEEIARARSGRRHRPAGTTGSRSCVRKSAIASTTRQRTPDMPCASEPSFSATKSRSSPVGSGSPRRLDQSRRSTGTDVVVLQRDQAVPRQDCGERCAPGLDVRARNRIERDRRAAIDRAPNGERRQAGPKLDRRRHIGLAAIAAGNARSAEPHLGRRTTKAETSRPKPGREAQNLSRSVRRAAS